MESYRDTQDEAHIVGKETDSDQEEYYDAQDEIKAVTKNKGDTGNSKEENYCNS